MVTVPDVNEAELLVRWIVKVAPVIAVVRAGSLGLAV